LLKQILSCPDRLANPGNQLAVVTRSSLDFAVAEALPDVSGDPCPAKHIVGGTGAARIGQDRLRIGSKSPKSGKHHKSSFFNVPSFCVSLYLELSVA
jgi:hypothetical protein